MTTRRSFIASILAAGAAPGVARSGVLMPVRSLILPEPLSLVDATWTPAVAFPNHVRMVFLRDHDQNIDFYRVDRWEDMQPLRNGDRITFGDDSGRSATLWRMV